MCCYHWDSAEVVSVGIEGMEINMGIKEIKKTIGELIDSPNPVNQEGNCSIDWEQLNGFIGDRTAMIKLLSELNEEERKKLIERAKKYGTRVNGWGYRFAKGNRGLTGKGKYERVDYRQLCLIGWKDISEAVGLSEDSLRYYCNIAGIKLPKWSQLKPGKGSSAVYIPKQYLSLLLLRLFYGAIKIPSYRRFELMYHSMEASKRGGYTLFEIGNIVS